MAVKVVIRWITRDEGAILKIRDFFGLPTYTTLNGFTPGLIEDSKIEMFKETAQRGFFSFNLTEWTFNGKSYSWPK